MRQVLHNRLLFLVFCVVFVFSACSRGNDPIPAPLPPPPPPPPVCGCPNTPLASDRYIYPPSRQLSFDSLRKISQIPAGQLAAMSTLGVIQSLETNPWFETLVFQNTMISGRSSILKAVNIGYELNTRVDAAAQLLEFYRNRYPCCIDTTKGIVDEGSFMMRWGTFDFICAQDDLLNKFSLAEKKEFVKILLAKDDDWARYPLFYNGFYPPNTRAGSIFLINRLMVTAQYNPYLNITNTLEPFFSSGIFLSQAQAELILQHAKQFVL